MCRLGVLLASVKILRHRAVFDGLAERFPVFVKRPDNLLIDVGCGRGDFLARLKSLGWNVLGIEPDPVSSSITRARGIDVFNGTLNGARLADNTADEIGVNHVIEHVHDPLSLLQECHRVLRPGGRLALYMPNIDSLGHRFFGRNWAGLDPPRHLFHFSPRSIGELLRRSPFRRYRIRTAVKISPGMYDTSLAIRAGGLNGCEEARRRRGRRIFKTLEALLCAALALVPGVSRSGATISAGLLLGLTREAATRYSFLLSVPAVVLSGLFELRKVSGGELDVVPTIVATIFAFIFGYLTIAWLLRYVRSHNFTVFVVYRVALGVVVLGLALGGVIP